MLSIKKAVFSVDLNLLLYSLLLVFTPFILLQNYLQDIIGIMSDAKFYIASVKVPYSILVLVIFILFFVLKTRKKINLRITIYWLVVFVFWFIGQNTSDYYLNSKYYDLQNNWHYIAYGLFVLVAYNSLSRKKYSTSKLILSIFFRALVISTFDEAIQIFLSNRVFDVSDIAKDMWGTMAGIILVFVGYNRVEIFRKGKTIGHDKLKNYLEDSATIIILLTVFLYILLFVSSLLSDSKYVLNILFITTLLFTIIFIVIHFSRISKNKWIIIGISSLLVLFLVYSSVSNWDKNISYNSNGITVYKGIPLPYFDILIYENGCFRFVDKKNNFSQGDISFLFEKASNILLIGSGESNAGRYGFPEAMSSQFIYNFKEKKPIQVIILPTKDACQKFNKLKQEGKKVTYIIHNTK